MRLNVSILTGKVACFKGLSSENLEHANTRQFCLRSRRSAMLIEELKRLYDYNLLYTQASKILRTWLFDLSVGSTRKLQP